MKSLILLAASTMLLTVPAFANDEPRLRTAQQQFSGSSEAQNRQQSSPERNMWGWRFNTNCNGIDVETQYNVNTRLFECVTNAAIQHTD